MSKVWLIRNGAFDEELVTGGFISIGWDAVPDLRTVGLTRDDLSPFLLRMTPHASPQSLAAQAGIIRRFFTEVAPGDVVVAPRPGSRVLRIGRVAGPYEYVKGVPTHHHRYPADWLVLDVRRDSLPEEARGTLHNISTLALVRRDPEFFRRLAEDPGSAGPYRAG